MAARMRFGVEGLRGYNKQDSNRGQVVIHDREAWEQFEAQFQRRMPADVEKNLRLFATWLAETRALGVWPPADPPEGLEVDLRIAKAVNTYVH